MTVLAVQLFQVLGFSLGFRVLLVYVHGLYVLKYPSRSFQPLRQEDHAPPPPQSIRRAQSLDELVKLAKMETP